jgi:hypothetical protein
MHWNSSSAFPESPCCVARLWMPHVRRLSVFILCWQPFKNCSDYMKGFSQYTSHYILRLFFNSGMLSSADYLPTFSILIFLVSHWVLVTPQQALLGLLEIDATVMQDRKSLVSGIFQLIRARWAINRWGKTHKVGWQKVLVGEEGEVVNFK